MITEIISINQPSPTQYVEVGSGQMISIPFTLGANQTVEIIVTHAAPTQDMSIRAHVSILPGGPPVQTNPEAIAFWHPSRDGNPEIITVFDHAITSAIFAQYPISASPGVLTLNVENLVNPINGFFVEFITTDH